MIPFSCFNVDNIFLCIAWLDGSSLHKEVSGNSISQQFENDSPFCASLDVEEN